MEWELSLKAHGTDDKMFTDPSKNRSHAGHTGYKRLKMYSWCQL